MDTKDAGHTMIIEDIVEQELSRVDSDVADKFRGLNYLVGFPTSAQIMKNIINSNFNDDKLIEINPNTLTGLTNEDTIVDMLKEVEYLAAAHPDKVFKADDVYAVVHSVIYYIEKYENIHIDDERNHERELDRLEDTVYDLEKQIEDLEIEKEELEDIVKEKDDEIEELKDTARRNKIIYGIN